MSGWLLECNLCLQVVGMEPSDEPFSVSITDLLIGGQAEGPVPLQGDTVNILASILTPTFCPSVLSSKFRVSVLLYGLAGVFYIVLLCFVKESVISPMIHRIIL